MELSIEELSELLQKAREGSVTTGRADTITISVETDGDGILEFPITVAVNESTKVIKKIGLYNFNQFKVWIIQT